MNDPYRDIQFIGRYHLDYKHKLFGAVWENIQWDHAVGDDLVNWEVFQIAITPSINSPDQGECWSGSFANQSGEGLFSNSGHKLTTSLNI